MSVRKVAIPRFHAWRSIGVGWRSLNLRLGRRVFTLSVDRIRPGFELYRDEEETP
jgi:hypothetical protein